MLSVVSAVPVWLWIVALNLLAVVWHSLGEVKELQCESKRATLVVRVMVLLCACVLGALFWLSTVLGAQLRRQGLAGQPPAPESDETIRQAVDRLRRDQLIDQTADGSFEWSGVIAARMKEEQELTRLRAAQAIGRQA